MSHQSLHVMSQLLAGLGGGERMAREGGEPSRLGTRNHYFQIGLRLPDLNTTT